MFESLTSDRLLGEITELSADQIGHVSGGDGTTDAMICVLDCASKPAKEVQACLEQCPTPPPPPPSNWSK
jgi:hypothetical protein